MTNYKFSITSLQQDKIRFFNRYFKDPPHYNQLLAGRGTSAASAPPEPPQVLSGDNSNGDDDSGDINSRDGNTEGRGEISTSEIFPRTKTTALSFFSENMRDDSRTRVFSALKFLRDRLRHNARLEDRNFTFRIVRGGLLSGISPMTWLRICQLSLYFVTSDNGGPGGSHQRALCSVWQIDIEATERLHGKVVDKETELREEAAKARRSSQTYVVAHQGTSQSSGTSSTHRGQPFGDEDDEDCDSQMEYDPNNVLDDVSTNNSSSLAFNWQSSMIHDMTPAEFLVSESDCDDASSHASTPLLSLSLPPLRAFSVEKLVGSSDFYSRGPYNKKLQQRYHQQRPKISTLDTINTSISEMDAKLEQMAKKFAGTISGINARLDELSKGLMGENGVSLRSLQYSTQKDLEKLEKKVDAIMECCLTSSRRISPGSDVGSHEYRYNFRPQYRPP
ncbi:hypothetical protein KI688_006496 [Linnemannia hyalina]|uniref:Uncharacterized protein n=1 Tax=Linnemannia hyalina TaxID=64524 RepID=A0A9P7XKB9_9FUNG|nr:hypothetical protein KI688_006496 [Linnemannia hyalina]